MAIVDHRRRDPGVLEWFEKPLWTAHEVAELLGVSHEYVWQLSREGRIPTVSLGRTRRYRKDSILDWLEQIESPGGHV